MLALPSGSFEGSRFTPRSPNEIRRSISEREEPAARVCLELSSRSEPGSTTFRVIPRQRDRRKRVSTLFDAYQRLISSSCARDANDSDSVRERPLDTTYTANYNSMRQIVCKHGISGSGAGIYCAFPRVIARTTPVSSISVGGRSGGRGSNEYRAIFISTRRQLFSIKFETPLT